MSDDSRVGTGLAGYRIESLLGWGGLSVVYLPEDLRLKRRVALNLAAGRAEDDSRSSAGVRFGRVLVVSGFADRWRSSTATA